MTLVDLQNGLKVIKYEDLPSDVKYKLELEIKFYRIQNEANVTFNGKKLYSILLDFYGVKIITLKKNGKENAPFHYTNHEFFDKEFLSDQLKITGDPFLEI